MRGKKMGMLKVRARVANPADPERFFEEHFLVDAGTMYTLIPEDRLREIGIEPQFKRERRLADGTRLTRLMSETLITIPDLDETCNNLIVFAEKGSPCSIGLLTLENFGVEPDPVTGKLKPIPMIIA